MQSMAIGEITAHCTTSLFNILTPKGGKESNAFGQNSSCAVSPNFLIDFKVKIIFHI